MASVLPISSTYELKSLRPLHKSWWKQVKDAEADASATKDLSSYDSHKITIAKVFEVDLVHGSDVTLETGLEDLLASVASFHLDDVLKHWKIVVIENGYGSKKKGRGEVRSHLTEYEKFLFNHVRTMRSGTTSISVPDDQSPFQPFLPTEILSLFEKYRGNPLFYDWTTGSSSGKRFHSGGVYK
jgi:hypothetical protein